MSLIIAIDGPAGAGKSTAARSLAAALRMPHFDTGAVYRAVAKRVLDAGADPHDRAEAERFAASLEVGLDPQGVLLDGERPGAGLRTRAVAIAASQVSVHPGVRAVLVAKQRAALELTGGVAEGRDIGTVVAPDAALKVFLTANPRARAKRRAIDLGAQGEDADLDALAEEIAQRDARDATRAISPLRPAEDAHLLDTSEMDPQAVLEHLLALASKAGISIPGAPS